VGCPPPPLPCCPGFVSGDHHAARDTCTGGGWRERPRSFGIPGGHAVNTQYGSRPPRGKIISNRPGLASCRSLTRSPGGYVGEAGTAVSQATVVAEPGPRSPRFLSSKFRAPKLVPQLVRRSRLLDQLDRGEQVRLALLVGPAGAGKTMLLADWLAARPERPSAWLSCDAADADPARFVAAIVEPARHGFGQPQLVPAS
jgi:hypothetical protein